jgi:hypothetical protein
MNLRAPYSPGAPARKARFPHQAAHFRHADPRPKIAWNHCLAGAGGDLVVDRDGRGANAVAGGFRAVASDILCGGRIGLGAAGDADRELDGAAGRLTFQATRFAAPPHMARRRRGKRCTCEQTASRNSIMTAVSVVHSAMIQYTIVGAPGFDEDRRVGCFQLPHPRTNANRPKTSTISASALAGHRNLRCVARSRTTQGNIRRNAT